MALRIANKKELQILKAKYSHLEFMKYCWQRPLEPLVVGIHTREICRLIDEAIDNLRQGQSTFLLIKVHFRAGKSDIISRYLPPHFLGEFPDKDVIVASYGQSLSESFSRFSRALVKSEQFKEIYPDCELTGGVQSWGFENHLGNVLETGITSGITGRGGSLLICDDYCASRAEAESETIRESTWEHFTNDFLTRRAPASIVIVLATPWHVDDIIGRIEKRIDPSSDSYDPNFPQFKVVSFPAMDADVEIGIKDRELYGDNKYHLKTIHYDYLFPERYDENWYKSQFASLGSYAASGLLQCNPQIRGGNFFDTSNIHFHDNVEDFPKTRYYRLWDLAHTAKQTQKADPDFTSGTLLTYTKIDGLWHLWIKNVVRIRASAGERDNLIRSATDKDGQSVAVAIENSLDSKDAVSNMQEILKGRRSVIPLNIRMDKIARAGYVEPIFEAGHVHVLRADWNLDWLQEVKEFPSGKHDDQVDNFTAGYQLICQNSSGQIMSGRVSGV